MKKYYVYIHKKADTKEIFYVGISGSTKYTRGYSSNQRNNLWNKIVKKHGYIVDIIHDDISKIEAIKIECELIKRYGKIINKTGCLCNITDGGEGANKTIEERLKISEKMKGENNPNYGKTMSLEQRIKIKETILSKKIKRPMSKKHKENIKQALLNTKREKTSNKCIINTETNQEFKSIKECLEFYKITYGVFYRIIKNGGGRIPLKYK